MRKFIAIVLASLSFFAIGRSQTNDYFQRTEDVVYGHKFGMALTMDVFRPKTPNGVGIIYIVSGGWFSKREFIHPAAYGAFLDRGYTVFAVEHGSQPKYIIPEIIEDMHRAVRFIRHNAASYGIDPARLGVIGASSGGHLTLVLATQTGGGPVPQPMDAVDRESSAVQCAACFFPPTDFLNYGGPGETREFVGELKDYKPAFGPLVDTDEGRQKLGREISPIYNVTSNLPPTLIIHGDADPIVPLQQSESFAQKAREAGATVKLIVKPGQKHGWKGWDSEDMSVCADWFDEHLRGIKPPSGAK